MSVLTIRPLKKADWTWINTLPANARLDPRGVNSPNVYTFICLEANKPIGVTMGRATGGDTCFLDYIRSPRRDAFRALIKRQAENGIATRHKYAQVHIPTDEAKQCTAFLPTSALTSELTDSFGFDWEDEGFDIERQTVAWKRSKPIELQPLVDAIAVWLKANGVTVNYA